MRGFIIISFISFASGGRLEHLENHQQTGNIPTNYLPPLHQQQLNQQQHSQLFQSASVPFSFTNNHNNNFQNFQTGLGISNGNLFGPAVNNYQNNNNGYGYSQQQLANIFKHVYVHVPPEEHELPLQPRYISLGPPRINYRVIFIKAPSETRKSTITLKEAPHEEKTVIYVLAKKAEEPNIQADIQIAPTEPSKPEVFFIKYKTKEEAVHAQHEIQAQYDALGGTSQVSDEGIAPVTSVIGSIPNNSNGHGSDIGTIPSSEYLPSNH